MENDFLELECFLETEDISTESHLTYVFNKAKELLPHQIALNSVFLAGHLALGGSLNMSSLLISVLSSYVSLVIGDAATGWNLARYSRYNAVQSVIDYRLKEKFNSLLLPLDSAQNLEGISFKERPLSKYSEFDLGSLNIDYSLVNLRNDETKAVCLVYKPTLKVLDKFAFSESISVPKDPEVLRGLSKIVDLGLLDQSPKYLSKNGNLEISTLALSDSSLFKRRPLGFVSVEGFKECQRLYFRDNLALVENFESIFESLLKGNYL